MEINSYSHSYSLTAADMDNDYRMTPNAVLLYYQDCWARYMSVLHLAAFDVVKENKMWVITQFNAWFEQSTAFWSDDVEVTVWNSEIGAMRLFADFIVRRPDGAEVAHGFGCWTLLDTAQHTLCQLKSLPEPLPMLDKLTAGTHKKVSFPTEGKLLREIDHKVNSINLDFNGHVNNRTYLSIAMQTVSSDFMQQSYIRLLSVRWLHETFLADTIHCVLLQLSEHTYLHNLTNQRGEPVAMIYTESEQRTGGTTILDVALRK